MLWSALWFKRNEPSKKHRFFLGGVRAGSSLWPGRISPQSTRPFLTNRDRAKTSAVATHVEISPRRDRGPFWTPQGERAFVEKVLIQGGGDNAAINSRARPRVKTETPGATHSMV